MHPPPLLPLLAALALAQAALFLLARGLSLRLPWRAMGMGVGLAVLMVSPWLVSDRIMVPNDEAILNNVPGTVPVPDLDRHGLFNDIPLQLLPWEFEVRRAYGSGRLPLWSDLLDGGSSPWVNPQALKLRGIAAHQGGQARIGAHMDKGWQHGILRYVTQTDDRITH